MPDKWQKKGKCKTGAYEPSAFFDDFELLEKPEKRKFIAKTCDICPVKNECGEWAHENKPAEGLYAGTYWRDSRPRNPIGVRYVEPERDRRHRLKKPLTKAA